MPLAYPGPPKHYLIRQMLNSFDAILFSISAPIPARGQQALAGQGYEIATENGLNVDQVLALSPEVLDHRSNSVRPGLLRPDHPAQVPPDTGR